MAKVLRFLGLILRGSFQSSVPWPPFIDPAFTFFILVPFSEMMPIQLIHFLLQKKKNGGERVPLKEA